jgi:formamidopyrimidine-DNA glycosylase
MEQWHLHGLKKSEEAQEEARSGIRSNHFARRSADGKKIHCLGSSYRDAASRRFHYFPDTPFVPCALENPDKSTIPVVAFEVVFRIVNPRRKHSRVAPLSEWRTFGATPLRSGIRNDSLTVAAQWSGGSHHRIRFFPMPELPEVETMVRGVRGDCEGRVITQLEFVKCRRRPIQVVPSPRGICKAVAGRTLTRVWRLAKRIILELDSGDSVVVEPRMTGLLLLADPPTVEHRRVVWHFQPVSSKAAALEFWDRRGLGTLSVLTPEQIETLRARLGPDAISMELKDWRMRLGRTAREIKVALLDQNLVGGIGNLYASEILHRARISPLRSAATLTNQQLRRLSEAAHEILADAIRCEGSTLSDGTYRNALSKDGTYQNHHRVYQRAGELCQSCGKGRICRVVQAQRATFYCAQCQR